MRQCANEVVAQSALAPRNCVIKLFVTFLGNGDDPQWACLVNGQKMSFTFVKSMSNVCCYVFLHLASALRFPPLLSLQWRFRSLHRFAESKWLRLKALRSKNVRCAQCSWQHKIAWHWQSRTTFSVQHLK